MISKKGMIRMGKKGVVYSLLTLLLLSPLILLTLNYSESLRGYGKQLGGLIRTEEGFFFMESMHQDLERAGQIIGTRAILAVSTQVINDNSGIDNAPLRLEELFLNGTINGNTSASMSNSTIGDWLDNIKSAASRRAFLIDLQVTDVLVDMNDPFNVRYTVNYSLKVEDQRGSFILRDNVTKTSLVSIEGFEDVTYPISTLGKGFNIIEKSLEDNFTSIVATGSGANGWSSGIAYVVPSGFDISSITNKSLHVLVIDEVNLTNNATASQFAAVVTENLVGPAVLTNTYIINDSSTSLIENSTRIVVDDGSNEVWNITSLYLTWEDQTYVANDDGPSFFDRLEGSFTNTRVGMGVESIVNKQVLKNGGVITFDDKTSMDHVYFSNASSTGDQVKGMPNEFRIDASHQSFYNVGDIAY